jgi:ribonuclease BN (tRNA processing enzyme)
MQLRILGCSGGIGGSLRTTSMLLDHDVLIDAGTGVGDLTLTELKQIDHIFVTHSHLDHVVSIPFLVDTVGGMRESPVTVHATEETLDILRKHLFNWKIWPDFAEIPNRDEPYLRYESLRLGQIVRCAGADPRAAGQPLPAVSHLVAGQPRVLATPDRWRWGESTGSSLRCRS